MTEYICKQDAVDAIHEFPMFMECNEIYIYQKRIEKIPAADVVPVRHGKWTHKPDVYGVVYCSECNYELHANSTSFCPNCGAKMDGGKED